MHSQNPKTFTKILQNQNNIQQCLMSLTLDSSQDQKSSALIGDYIGVESCLDLEKNEDVFSSSSKKLETKILRNQRYCNIKKKEFPPPIPSLARTGNLPSRMPWVLRRYYTNDGRLILKEERVKHHEYFRAHRSNGRLTLQLVPLDDEVYPPLDYSDDEEEEEEEEEEGDDDEKFEEIQGNENEPLENSCSEEEKEGEGEEDESDDCVGYYKSGISGNVGPFKCLNYNTVATGGSTCSRIFTVPLPAVRPIHS
ncbi:protein FANTASTIC FOUR 1 [Jatropha curcas]|uniref:protein FANTASTIC FOUR 1 n=1 Tax=Jatropha curcas TaxID=180498 RepID=UPI001894BE0F|nr:protein FANTASTIC FOUR 1 [Jatropha curcas]